MDLRSRSKRSASSGSSFGSFAKSSSRSATFPVRGGAAGTIRATTSFPRAISKLAPWYGPRTRS